jgi:hypothetical protein
MPIDRNKPDKYLEALFKKHGVAAAFIRPTETGLSKSIIDAHRAIRELLLESGLHDYSIQQQGPEHKRTMPASILLADSVKRTVATVNRPRSGNGDPRIWFRGLSQYASAGDWLALISIEGAIYLANMSDPTILASAEQKGTPLYRLLNTTIGSSQSEHELSAEVTSAGSSPAVAEDSAVSTNAHAMLSAFQRLQKRAFGGEDVAARPGSEDDSWWPKGPLLPGVGEVLDAFESAVNNAEGLSIVFLLGGAGNGKSYAARELSSRLGLGLSGEDSLALRAYRVTRGNAQVELINDATIASKNDYGELQAVALCADIERLQKEVATTPVAVFCCVNRGIVIDELRALGTKTGSGDLSAAILGWLASTESSLAGRLSVAPLPTPAFVPHTLRGATQYRAEAFEWNGTHIWVAALSVDASSLMEPVVAGGPSRARSLFDQVADRCKEEAEERPILCPVRANVLQWLNPQLTEIWEKVMFSAEIASGRPHSYREVWGLAALSVLGPRYVDDSGVSDLISFIDRRLKEFDHADSARLRLAALLELSRFRAHEALFRAAYPAGSELQPVFPPPTPAHAGLTLIDPSSWGAKDVLALEEAMQAISVGVRPSLQLQESERVPIAWSQFDDALEAALMEHLLSSECPDVERRRLISWWSGYLIRLAGLSSGNVGNAIVVETWLDCWRACKNGPAALPFVLQAPMRTLLFPSQDGSAAYTMLIPAFAPRVEPLRASRDGLSPKLAEVVSHSSVGMQIRRVGNRLQLECKSAGVDKLLGSIAFDFPLMREALACCDGRAGQTEATAFIEPRIERCRSTTIESMPSGQRTLVSFSGNVPLEIYT